MNCFEQENRKTGDRRTGSILSSLEIHFDIIPTATFIILFSSKLSGRLFEFLLQEHEILTAFGAKFCLKKKYGN